MTASAILVFSRMDSKRLPGKAFLDIGERPMLGRVLDRLRRVRPQQRIVVATSQRSVDDPIADFAGSERVELFRGDCDDVAGRALACCDKLQLDFFVRISGDSPFIPPELVERAIGMMADQDADIVTNVFPRSWPAGTSVEAIKTDVLRRAHPQMNAQEREDVSPFFYAHTEDWRMVNIPAPDKRYKDVRLTVDTPEELERARSICDRLGQPAELATLDEVVGLSFEAAGAA